MSLEHSRNAVKSVIGKVTQRTPTIKVRDFSVNDNGLTRIVADVTHTSTSKSNDSEVYAAFTAKFGNKMNVVENSFVVLSSNQFTDVVTGVLAPKQDAVAFDSESCSEGFKMLAGNMYMDTNEDLWKLKKTEGGEILIKTNSLDDIDAINALMSESTANMTNPLSFETEDNVMASFSSLACSVDSGDFIDFVNPVTNELAFGVVVASVEEQDEDGNVIGDMDNLVVLSSSGESHTIISRELIVDSHNDVEVPAADESAYDSMSGSMNLEAAVEYYRSMFRRSPEYFAKFEARLRSHAFQG